MPNTKLRKDTLLRLLDAHIQKLKVGRPTNAPGGFHPLISLACENIEGQIAALEDVRAILTGERKGFTE